MPYLESLSGWKVMTLVTVSTALRYLLFAGVAWLLGYVWFRRRWLHRKIIQRLPGSAQVRREMRDSAARDVLGSRRELDDAGGVVAWLDADVLGCVGSFAGLVVGECGADDSAA